MKPDQTTINAATEIPLRWEDLRRLQKFAARRDETIDDAALFLIHKGVYTCPEATPFILA